MKKKNFFSYSRTLVLMFLMLTITLLSSVSIYANFRPADYTYSDPEIITDYDYTLVGIPDIQNITKWKAGTLSQMFMKLTTRAKQNKLAFAFSVGDLVQDATDAQFQTAREAFTQFDEAEIPYAVVPGNHDYDSYTGDIPTDKRDTMYNKYFNYNQYKDLPTFGAARVENNMVNTYHLFEAGGVKYLLMALEDAPTKEVLDWSDGIISHYSDRRTIVVTHDYFLRPTGNTVPRSQPGEAVWEMAKKHQNMFMIFSGHRSTLNPVFVMGTGDKGNKIMQIMICFQNTFDANGDNVPLAFYMRFNERTKMVNYSVINPVTDKLFNNNQIWQSFEDVNNPTVGAKAKTYSVTWRNYDGSVLELDPQVVEGDLPKFNSNNPTKPSDSENRYEFAGWTTELQPVTSDITYIAKYNIISLNTKTYTVYWMNYDGTLLETDSEVKPGSMPSFDSTLPARLDDEKNSYTFAGWNPSLSAVTKDVIYTAQFIPTPLQTQADSTPAGCGNTSLLAISVLGLMVALMVPLFTRKYNV